jgi:hypothetical protein
MDAAKAVKAVEASYPSKDRLISTMPKDSTIADVDAAFEAQTQAYKDWRDAKSLGGRSFSGWLEEVSEGRVLSVSNYAYEHSLKVDQNWGHNHGLSLDYADKTE